MGTRLFLSLCFLAAGAPLMADASPVVKTNGPLFAPDSFPIGVWLQDPIHADAYKRIGVNLYVGLWEGPTLEQLNELKLAGMPVICLQNEVGLAYRDKSTIVGWMHTDEPDNAQPLPLGTGHGAPIPPERIQWTYEKMKEADPSRPVFLNLGQGAAWDGWWGRGARSGNFGDYIEYLKGCDVGSFDIYPYAHDHPDVNGKLEFVARGVERLRSASRGTKPIWNIIGVAGVGSGVRPSAEQIRSMVWMSIIHGSRGVIYFVHEWKPRFRSATLAEDSDLANRVHRVNQEILALAPVIHSATVSHVRNASPEGGPHPAISAHVHEGALYAFTVEMTGRPVDATFSLSEEWGKRSEVSVVGEGRRIPIREGRFRESYAGYEVKLFRLDP